MFTWTHRDGGLQYQHYGCAKGDDAKYAINVPVAEIAETNSDRVASNLAK